MFVNNLIPNALSQIRRIYHVINYINIGRCAVKISLAILVDVVDQFALFGHPHKIVEIDELLRSN
ncbi:unnamed protein product [Amoebophrya sp. A25]|nr:unnamed protein product [Amoebophrya sp. A25]|eukprot:GSA25T00010965001.1